MIKMQPKYMNSIYYEKQYARVVYYFDKEP